jgi:dTDP-4-amino-4,6-dideoxygalactose transaminase
MTTSPSGMDRPIRSTFLIFGAPAIGEAEIQEVVDTLRSGWLGTGPRCQRFEESFRGYIGCQHAVAVNSCTAGLELALEAADVGPGDEVITTPLTFCATANVIVHRGAKPVFVDVERETGNIDPERVGQAVNSRTKAIIPVHLYGRPCRMKELLEIARRHDLYVIEDAAHATEAWQQGRKVGNIGDATVFSFYVTKNMTTGEGGMVTTNNSAWADEMRVKRLHGLDRDAWKRYSADGFQPYDVLAAGYKYNMTDLQAALGIHQLARLEENLEIRRRYWAMYEEAFRGMPGLVTPSEHPEGGAPVGDRHARHLFTVLIKPELAGISRWDFVKALRSENIGTGIHFLALHLHSYYRNKFGYKPGDFPNAEYIGDRTVSLPLSVSMSDDDVQDVISAVKRVCRRKPAAPEVVPCR